MLYTTTALDAAPQVLLDPNTLSTDGTVALSGTAVSDDGKLLAYGIAQAGSDWSRITAGEGLSRQLDKLRDPDGRWKDELRFGPDGLLPVVAQHHASGQVLMVAFANR